MSKKSFSMVIWSGIFFIFLNFNTAVAGPDANSASRERLLRPDLTENLLGAIAYLEDTQIRNRPGKGHPTSDSTEEGDGAKSEVTFNLPFKENLPIPAPPVLKIRNRTGEWASHVHFLPKKTGFNGRNLVSVQDSNVFMTTFIGYPLFLVDDSELPANRQFISRILPLAMKNVESFKLGAAYNFWAAQPGVFGKDERTGPFNIPPELISKLAKAFINPRFDKFFAFLTRGLKTPPKFWVEQCLDPKNPTGADALFNIPNDADDTATAVAFQALYRKKYPKARLADSAALKHVSGYRDLDRSREDGRDLWKGKKTGAFLTWMKDENQPIFGTPGTGVIPLGVNNVDCVVNANVVFSLAVNNMKDTPGYSDAVNLLVQAIEKHAWPDAGLYYPQYMIFPYTATRAWRDGGAREPQLTKAMEKLLKDLLGEQETYGKRNPAILGAFPGGEDRSDHLSTALGLSALLNIGRGTAEKIGMSGQFDRGVSLAVAYICRSGRNRDMAYPTTREIFSAPKMKVRAWLSGLFFSASFWDLGHWRSEPFTVSMVAEALAKYALAYDLDRGAFGKRQLRLTEDPNSRWGLKFEAR